MCEDLTNEITKLCQGKATEEEVNRIFRDLYPRIFSFFCSRGLNRSESEDQSQEAFHRIVRRAPSCRDERRFRSWAFAIAANIYRNEVRHRMTSKRSLTEVSLESVKHERLFEIQDSRAVSPEEQAMEKELRQRLKRYIARLPPQQHNVLRLSLQGRSQNDIAKILGISIGTVKAHLHQARQALKKRLAEAPGNPGDLPQRGEDGAS